MICEVCKMREANIRYTEVINGVRNEHNLCSHCAQSTEIGHYAAIFEGEFPFSKLLSDILGMEHGDSLEQDEKLEKINCPTCNTSYHKFVKNSKFGCPDCYSVFDLLIGDNIKKLQGSDTHVGKKPKFQKEGRNTYRTALEIPENLPFEEELSLLDSKLKESIRDEKYEMAAKYRDEIKALKERNENHGEMV